MTNLNLGNILKWIQINARWCKLPKKMVQMDTNLNVLLLEVPLCLSTSIFDFQLPKVIRNIVITVTMIMTKMKKKMTILVVGSGRESRLGQVGDERGSGLDCPGLPSLLPRHQHRLLIYSKPISDSSYLIYDREQFKLNPYNS